MKTFEFSLSESISYHNKGESQEGHSLTLTAPTVKARKKAAKLKQGVMRAVSSLQGDANIKPEDKKSKEDIKPEEILALIQMSSIEYDEYMDIFIDLLCKGICKIEDEIEMTAQLADKMSFEDTEKLMGEYLINFILGSLGN